MKTRHTPKRHSRRKPYQPALEALEPRWCPSATFTLNKLADGHMELIVQGDKSATSMRIVDKGSPQKDRGDTLAITSPFDPTGPGDPPPQTFTDVERLVVRTNDGNDSILFTGALVRCTDIDLQTGGGGDAIALDQFSLPTEQTAHHQIRINSGTAGDRVSFRPIINLPTGRIDELGLDIQTGLGNDFVALRGVNLGPHTGAAAIASLTATAAGSLIAVDTGEGDDALSLADCNWTGPVTVSLSMGAGNDHVAAVRTMATDASIIAIHLGEGTNSVRVEDNMFVGPVQLKVDAGAGNDTASFSANAALDAHLSFLLGLGNDVARLDDNMLGAVNLAIYAGGGNDTVSFHHDRAHDLAVIAILMEGGADVVTMDQYTFGGGLRLTLDAGSGDDFVALRSNTALPYIEAKVLLGAGNDQVVLKENKVGRGSLLVDAGSNDDRATLLLGEATDGSFNVLVYMGLGNDRLNVLAPCDPTMLVARLGDGDDTAEVHVGPWTNLGASHKLLVDGGTGADHVLATVDVPNGATGALDVEVLGGSDDDELTLLVHGNLSRLAQVFLLLDGGPGNDQGSATSNVTWRNF